MSHIWDECKTYQLCRDSSTYPAPGSLTIPRSANTCSDHSHRRGPGQRVVAFSYYEHDDKMRAKRVRTGNIKESHFISGILINIERLQEYYPGNVKCIVFLFHHCN